MATFGFASTADEVLEGKDLSGKTVLVTGGYSGLGMETARAMAARSLADGVANSRTQEA